jgi:membrane protein
MKLVRATGRFLSATYQQWSEKKAPTMAAALAYYTIFSIAPLMIILIAAVGLLFGRDTVRQQLVAQIQGLVGENGAQAIDSMIQGANNETTGIIATVISLVVLLYGATSVFAQLQDSLDVIWDVKPKPGRAWLTMLKDRVASFSMILAIGFIMLVSLVLSAAISAVGTYASNVIPAYEAVMQIGNFVIGFAITTVLFAMIYKILPDVKIRWNDVWIGALVTAFLFSIGRFLIGLYLGKSSVASAYGAAGSLVIILIWIYYSGQILFFGASFTKVYSESFGSKAPPKANAEPLKPREQANIGITPKHA